MIDDATILELKNHLRDYVDSITPKSKGKNYVCPLCHSGEGAKGTGAFSVYEWNGEQRWKCHSCNAKGDIFELYGQVEGISSYIDQVKGIANKYGIYLQDYRTSASSKTYDWDDELIIDEKNNLINLGKKNTTPAEQKQATKEKNMTETKAEEKDYSEYFQQVRKNIGQTDYHRGLSMATLKKFAIGYDASWVNPENPKAPSSPRLIIPTSPSSYMARDTREEHTDFAKLQVGGKHIFNIKALSKAIQPIFVVEGEIDALSIIDAGGEAIGLGGISMQDHLIKYIQENGLPVQPLIIALDNDAPGIKAQAEFEKKLIKLKIPCYRFSSLFGDCKDANDALCLDREEFAEKISQVNTIEKLQENAVNILTEEADNYKKSSTAFFMKNFLDGISESVDTPFIPTGFPTLDNYLDGGLYEGLYILGAISSLGKTTIVMQIADQIAKQGHDVLIFSLEMATSEMIAKSLSRITIQTVIENKGSTRDAKTVRGITNGKLYENYSKTERELIALAIDKYKEYANHVYINEGLDSIGVEEIRETVRKHIEFTGNKPVVFIDYLQILKPNNERSTDKQNTDKAVMELKKISREYKIPVFAISSFNRENYKSKVSMESFKESGAIEYSSDVLLGLQFEGAGEKTFDVDRAKAENPRHILLKILKNRNGKTGDNIFYNYFPMFNYYAES